VAVNTYEILFLLDPNKFSSDPDGTTKVINDLIEHYGGEILYSRPWGEPKLAYPIKNFKKGSYLLTYFKGDSKGIPQLEHDCRLSEVILRHLVIRLHPKIAEKVVEHLNTVGHWEPSHEPAEAGVGRDRGDREHDGDHRDRDRDRDRGDRGRGGRGDRGR
jgi:small subunit ribosomal protein S6